MSKNGTVQVSLEILVESLTKGGGKRDTKRDVKLSLFFEILCKRYLNV